MGVSPIAAFVFEHHDPDGGWDSSFKKLQLSLSFIGLKIGEAHSASRKIRVSKFGPDQSSSATHAARCS